MTYNAKRRMVQSDRDFGADPEDKDLMDDTRLAEAMRTVPLGAAVLAGSMVALLVLGYLLIYLLVFLPRGTVG